MRRIIGFIIFWMAIGMLIAIFIPKVITLLITAALLLLGYNLFCC